MEYKPKTIDGKQLTLTTDQIVSINSGVVSLWVYGAITYRDIFSGLLGPIKFGYCFHYAPGNDPTTGMFNACEEENYTYVH